MTKRAAPTLAAHHSSQQDRKLQPINLIPLIMCRIERTTFHCGHVDRSIIPTKKCKDFAKCSTAPEKNNAKYDDKKDQIYDSAFDCFECREKINKELIAAGKITSYKVMTRKQMGEIPLEDLLHVYGQKPRESFECITP